MQGEMGSGLTFYHETTTFVQEYQFFDYKEDLSAEMINTFPIFAIRKVTL